MVREGDAATRSTHRGAGWTLHRILRASCLAVSIGLLAGIVVLNWAWRSGLVVRQPEPPDLPKIAAFADIDFPPGAKLLKCEMNGFVDYNIWAMVALPHDQVQVMIDGLPEPRGVSRTKFLGFPDNGLPDAPDWFTPFGAGRFVAVAVDLDEIRRTDDRLVIVMDLDHADAAVMYFWYYII